MGGQEDGRNTTVKPNVTNEAIAFSLFFLFETTLPYFGYCRIQFFLYIKLIVTGRFGTKTELITEPIKTGYDRL